MTATPDARRAIFIAASRLLAYPDHALWALLPDIIAYLHECPASDDATTTEAVARLVSVAERLSVADVDDLEARYVATFDFHEPAALYLTAHELGDSRRRGRALVDLRRLLRAADFEETTNELPDYLPLLLEFLAHAPVELPADATQALEERLAAVCERIHSHLDANNPYQDVFDALLTVFPKPAPADAHDEPQFTDREQADTGEMPYPLHYD